MKAMSNSQKYLAIKAENALYYCEKCGFWETNSISDLYIPKDIETMKKRRFGEKKVEEWGFIPYSNLIKDFELYFSCPHECPNCKKRLSMCCDTYNIDEALPYMRCKECGGKMDFSFYNGSPITIDWD